VPQPGPLTATRRENSIATHGELIFRVKCALNPALVYRRRAWTRTSIADTGLGIAHGIHGCKANARKLAIGVHFYWRMMKLRLIPHARLPFVLSM